MKWKHHCEPWTTYSLVWKFIGVLGRRKVNFNFDMKHKLLIKFSALTWYTSQCPAWLNGHQPVFQNSNYVLGLILIIQKGQMTLMQNMFNVSPCKIWSKWLKDHYTMSIPSKRQAFVMTGPVFLHFKNIKR